MQLSHRKMERAQLIILLYYWQNQNQDVEAYVPQINLGEEEEEEENLFISPQKYTIMIHIQNETLQGKETSIKTSRVAVMDATWVNDVLNNIK